MQARGARGAGGSAERAGPKSGRTSPRAPARSSVAAASRRRPARDERGVGGAIRARCACGAELKLPSAAAPEESPEPTCRRGLEALPRAPSRADPHAAHLATHASPPRVAGRPSALAADAGVPDTRPP